MDYQSDSIRKRWPVQRVLVVLLLLLAGRGAEAQIPSGGIRGKVIDVDFSLPVANAVVQLAGTDRAVRTDADGNYFFNELPPGSYSVSATREGFKLRQTRQIAVSSGRVGEADLEMLGEVVELEDYVIETGDLLGGEAGQLLDVRASLVAFTDSIGADFIAKAGGSDAGDLVKRIVGTSVAESRYVVIRGLSDRYNTVLLNGARVPSSDPDKRAVNIDIFPSSLIGELTNTKTFSPGIPGESTGGSINIITKTSPDKTFAAFAVGSGFNSQATNNRLYVTYPGAGTGVLGTQNDRQIPGGLRGTTKESLPIPTTPQQLEASQRAARLLNPTTGTTTASPPPDAGFSVSGGTKIDNFLGGPLGLLAAFTYTKKFEFDTGITRNDTVIDGSKQPVLTKEFQSQEGGESLLSGLLLTAGWEPRTDTKFKLTIFANVAAEDRGYFQEGLALGSGTNNPDTVPIQDAESVAIREGLQYVERRLRTMQITGSHLFPDFMDASIDWGFTYSLSSQQEPDGRFATVQFDRPTRTFTQLGEFAGQNLQRYWRQLDDTNYSLNTEIKLPVFDGVDGEKILYRMGGSMDYSTRDFRADTFGYSNAIFGGGGIPLEGELGPSNEEGTTAADVVGRSNAGIGRARNPEVYEASQAIVAAYGVSEFHLAQKLRASVGLRVEVTDIRVFRDPSAFRTVSGALDASEGPVTDPFEATKLLPADKLGRADIEEVNVLPVVNLTWDFHENMKLRFAASRTVARPSFKELAPIYLDDPVSTDRFRGNSLLETSDIDNIDLRWEWFPSPGDVIAVSFFTKFIQRPIELFTNPTADFFANQDSAVIFGYEFEIQKNLGTLAEELRNFAIGINGSKFYSQVDLIDVAEQQRLDAGLDPNRRLQGQPDSLLNFNVTYDNKDFGLFAGLFLNITGETLYQAGSSSGSEGFSADVYQQPFTSLDFTLSQKLDDKWKVTVRAENLVNDDTIRTAEGNISYSKSSGTKYSFSLSATW